MHNKNNNKKSLSFIQGLRPFSTAIPKTLKKYLKTGGYNYSNIIDNWTKMVDKKISDACYPTSIKMTKEMRDGNLILNVIHGKELEIEYQKKEIVDKINSFFGYNLISKVTLKIVEEKLNISEKFSKIKDFNKLDKKVNNLKNDQLKNSLNSFLKAYNERSK